METNPITSRLSPASLFPEGIFLKSSPISFLNVASVITFEAEDGVRRTVAFQPCPLHLRTDVPPRGGVPLNGHTVDTGSFRWFVHARNAAIGARHDGFLAGLGLGPPLYGFTVDETGSYAAMWWIALGSFAVAAAVAFTWIRTNRRARTA